MICIQYIIPYAMNGKYVFFSDEHLLEIKEELKTHSRPGLRKTTHV